MPGFGLIKHDGSNGQTHTGRTSPHEQSYDMRTAKVGADNEFRKREPTRIGEFIQRQILGIQPGGQPVRMVLRHLGVNNQVGQRIGSQNIQNMSEDEISAMAVGVYDLAESDAIGLGNQSQKYVLLSFDEENPAADPSGRCIFEVQTGMVQPQDQEGITGRPGQYLDSNPPTEVGVIGQVMAQNRDLLGKVLQVVSASSGSQLALQTQVDRLMNRLAEEETRRFQNFDMLEKARGEQWVREKEAKLLEAELESKHEWIGLAKMAVPAILRRIGASDPKQHIEADDAQEIGLALQFASDQAVFDKAMAALPDEKSQVAFAEWVVFNVGRAEKWEAERSGKAPAGSAAQGQLAPPQSAAPQLQAPPSPEQLEQARVAQIEHAKAEAARWASQIKALEAQHAAGQTPAPTAAPAATPETAKPAETPAVAAAPAPAPKRSHAKKKSAAAQPTAPAQTEMPTTATPSGSETTGE